MNASMLILDCSGYQNCATCTASECIYCDAGFTPTNTSNIWTCEEGMSYRSYSF